MLSQTIQKAAQGLRLTPEEALNLAINASPHELGRLGLAARTRLHGSKAYWVYNQHLNYTNVCANACRFCAFHKKPGDQGSYAYSIDQAVARIRERAAEPVREIHVVGGLNPALPYDYYLDLLRAIKTERPDVFIKAFTAVEVAYLADTTSRTDAHVLQDLKSAGLDGLPGGGAEVFAEHLRQQLCPEKVPAERWLSVHATAHSLGLSTNATLLFGHIETWEDRIDHMLRLRDLQDQTGGFNVFIPLAYQPGPDRLNGRSGPDGLDFLKTIAIARLFLDNIRHIKAYWVLAGIKTAQLALHAGADDFDGTVVEENVGHAAGANSPKGLTVDDIKAALTMAGFTPVERDSRFQAV